VRSALSGGTAEGIVGIGLLQVFGECIGGSAFCDVGLRTKATRRWGNGACTVHFSTAMACQTRRSGRRGLAMMQGRLSARCFLPPSRSFAR
jgi:hypothetical protein